MTSSLNWTCQSDAINIFSQNQRGETSQSSRDLGTLIKYHSSVPTIGIQLEILLRSSTNNKVHQIKNSLLCSVCSTALGRLINFPIFCSPCFEAECDPPSIIIWFNIKHLQNLVWNINHWSLAGWIKYQDFFSPWQNSWLNEVISICRLFLLLDWPPPTSISWLCSLKVAYISIICTITIISLHCNKYRFILDSQAKKSFWWTDRHHYLIWWFYLIRFHHLIISDDIHSMT